MIQIYCGDGKGKTTAAMGLALRMAGNGGKVCVVQFLKGSVSGEVEMLVKNGINVSRCDRDYGFYKSMSETDRAQIMECHNQNLRKAVSELKDLDMLVLDEIFAAVNLGLVDMDLIRSAVEGCGSAEIVLTGRNPDKYFLDRADYISEIKKIRHPFDKGVRARKGVEF